jgi:hypothetical protein
MSKPNDSADNCGSSRCYAAFGGMAWPVPSERFSDIQWEMRYASESLTREDMLLAASVLSAYADLLQCDQQKREFVVSEVKKLGSDRTTDGDETDGMPIGWTIVATGDDGSVLCRAPNGQRARFWFHGKSA